MIFCGTLAFVSLIFEGTLFQLWSLHKGHGEIQQKIAQLKVESKALGLKIDKTSDPSFLEMEARNQFDLANEGDLIFVFSEHAN